MEQRQWAEMRAAGEMDALIRATLPLAEVSSEAAAHLMHALTSYEQLFLLSEETVDWLENTAMEGNRYAQFAYGRWHVSTRPRKESCGIARDMFEKAYAQGLPEAAVSLSSMLYYGMGDVVDRETADRLLHEALATGCGYARETCVKYLIYGLCDWEANPQKALNDIKLFCEEDTAHGLDENPLWHYYRACAVEELFGRTKAIVDYRKAADLGVTRAWLDLAVAYGYGDGKEDIINHAAYVSHLKVGHRHNNPDCSLFLALANVEHWEEMPRFTQYISAWQAILDIKNAYTKGSETAAEVLGDIYHYGQYGQKEDIDLAWEWYEKAARFGAVSAIEKMFDMIHDKLIERDTACRDMLALHGARLDSKRLLAETVIAHTMGRLADHAEEIEKYYNPVFDDPNFTILDDPEDEKDDLEEEDGRYDAYC